MLDIARADKRINELISLDEQTDKEFTQQFNDVLNFAKNNVYAFVGMYAGENGLSVTETAQNVSKWDKQQLNQAIKSLDLSNFSDEAQNRVDILAKKAGLNRGNLLNAIIGLGLIKLTDNQINTIDKRLDDDVNKQSKGLADDLDLSKKQQGQLSNVKQDDSWKDTFWIANDGIRNNVENIMNNNFRQGLKPSDIDKLFATHSQNKDKRPNKSIGDRIHQQISSASGNLRTQSSINVNKINHESFKIKGYDKVIWHTEPGACKYCVAISKGSPFKLMKAPIPGTDSHINCRCMLLPENYEDE